MTGENHIDRQASRTDQPYSDRLKEIVDNTFRTSANRPFSIEEEGGPNQDRPRRQDDGALLMTGLKTGVGPRRHVNLSSVG